MHPATAGGTTCGEHAQLHGQSQLQTQCTFEHESAIVMFSSDPGYNALHIILLCIVIELAEWVNDENKYTQSDYSHMKLLSNEIILYCNQCRIT